MQIVDIDEARTDLSRLVDQAANGQSFIIAKAGMPLVKVLPLDAPATARIARLGFMTGQLAVPDDFDSMGREAIEDLVDR